MKGKEVQVSVLSMCLVRPACDTRNVCRMKENPMQPLSKKLCEMSATKESIESSIERKIEVDKNVSVAAKEIRKYARIAF